MTTHPQTIYKPANYLAYIDGLRGISVLVILLFHLDVAYFSGGFIGVDIFFVISGYLITKIIARDILAGTFSFSGFYARRIRRIFPALFTMLFFTSIGAILFLEPQQFYDYFKAVRMASGQISNFLFSREVDYFAIGFNTSPLLHTWSLGVEEQFYVIWPVLLLIIHRVWGITRGQFALISLFLISLLLSEYLVRTNEVYAFYHLYSRAWELAMGGIVALKFIPKPTQRLAIEAISFLGLSLIIFSALFYEKGGFPGLKAIAPCLGAALIIYTAQLRTGYIHKLLSARILVFTGLISYSLYLWHWPLVAFYKIYFNTHLDYQVQTSIVVLSFLLAYLSYRFIEQPFRLGKASPGKTIMVGLLIIIVFIIASNLIKSQRHASWRLAYNLDATVTRPQPLSKICSTEGGAYDRKKCIIGPDKPNYEVILTGDSFASHYIPTVLEWAKSKGLTVRLFMRGACLTWIETNKVRMRFGKVDTYCTELSTAFYETLANDSSIKYVFLALSGYDNSDDMRKSLLKIKSYNKKIIVLGLVPRFKEHPNNCQIKNNLLIAKILPPPKQRNDCLVIDHDYSKKYLSRSLIPFLPLLDELNIPYFDPVPYIQSAFDENGMFMYMDAAHMNIYGALHLVPYLTSFIENTPLEPGQRIQPLDGSRRTTSPP